MSSKMFSWIKKRCGRRPEKPDGNLKPTDDTKLVASTNSPVYFSLHLSLLRQGNKEKEVLYDEVYEEMSESMKIIQTSPVSPIRQVNKAKRENSNDDIYDEIWKSSTITKHVTSHPSPEVQVCPLCRSKILTDNSCKCVILKRNVRSQKPKTDHKVSLSSLLHTTHDSKLSHPSDDDSSGFYESVGSDSMSSGEVYSDNSVTTDSDDGYEEVEFRPTLGHRRRYSIGSLHTVLQRSKSHSTFKAGRKDRNIALRRTLDRRSLKEKNVNN